MEHISTRDNSSPHPVEDPATSLIQPDPSILIPNKPKPLFRGFERPSYSRIAVLTVLCLITYPAFYVLTFVAKDKSIFIVRLFVAVWCSGFGFAFGPFILLRIAAQHLEAATWATVIHMSHEGDGIRFRNLAKSTGDPTSPLPALHIFWSRFRNQATSRRSRKSYDKRPWSLFLVYFIVLAILGALIPFLFGRVVEIRTFVGNKRKVYSEVVIAGDLSKEDINQADAQSLTFLRYGGITSDTAEMVYNNDTVYFAQPSLSQFIPGGVGSGTFDPSALVGLGNTQDNRFGQASGNRTTSSNNGVVLRYPQWGIRIHCEKLPNPEVNLIPSQNLTYAFVPQGFLRGLFAVYGMDLFTNPNSSGQIIGDIPSNIDLPKMAYLLSLVDTGESISTDSTLVDGVDPSGTRGWTTVETVLIRLDTSSTPSGRFPVSLNQTLPHSDWIWSVVGYDAAVCVQKHEPWIIEAYNTSIGSPPYAFRIIENENSGISLSPRGRIRGPSIVGSTRYLNTTGKDPAFVAARSIATHRMRKLVNYVDGDYLSSPTAASFTNGHGPGEYTELSPDRLANTLARVCAASALPYLAGSGPIVAQSYADVDETLAYVTFTRWQMVGLPLLIWILGTIGELFVPILPLDIPRRGFGVYSWLVLLQSQGLQFEAAGDLDNSMSLDELEEKLSDKWAKFVTKGGGLSFPDHHADFFCRSSLRREYVERDDHNHDNV